MRKLLLLVAMVGILLSVMPSPDAQACTFCNLNGYSSCPDLDGTSCAKAGDYRRCWVPPACYCEWGACTCDGTKWSCFW
ncbi:MAG TPA: hypothetical protein VF756_02305 [Thermoanaerobaculia bacterium]